MKYFELTNKFDTDREQVFTALDVNGESLINRHGYDLSGIDTCYFDSTRKEALRDKMGSIGIELILSCRASEIMRTSLRLCPTMYAVKTIFRRAGNRSIISSDYLLWLARKEYDVLDLRSSVIKFYKQRILSIKEWVLDAKKIPPLDIFLGPTHKWIVSGLFRHTFEEHNLTGCAFHELRLSP